MATQIFPKKNAEFIFYVFLTQQADPKLFQSNPTLAAGDVKVSIDGGAFANLGTLPDVDPNSSVAVKVLLSAAEMNGDNIQVTFIDAAGAQWCDLAVNIQTADRQVNDLAYPATSGRSLLVNATGAVPVSGLETAAKAEVNVEVADVIATDVVAEASGVPGTTGTVAGMLARLYAALRSGVVVNSATNKKQYKNDAGTVQWEKDLTDDGTSYTESSGNAP